MQHVFLDKSALRWRVALNSAACRGCCVVLSGLTPRTLFPEQPERCWPVLVASTSTMLALHGCALPPAAAAGALCTCDTCLRGDTVSMHAEVLEQELSDDGIAVLVRVGLGSCHAGREVPLLLAHHLSGTHFTWPAGQRQSNGENARRRTKPVAAAWPAAQRGYASAPRAPRVATRRVDRAGRLLTHDAVLEVSASCTRSVLPDPHSPCPAQSLLASVCVDTAAAAHQRVEDAACARRVRFVRWRARRA